MSLFRLSLSLRLPLSSKFRTETEDQPKKSRGHFFRLDSAIAECKVNLNSTAVFCMLISAEQKERHYPHSYKCKQNNKYGVKIHNITVFKNI